MNTGKLCPDGWRVPNDNDWNILMNYLGGTNVAGGKLKEKGTTHWSTPNTGATDEYEFGALPGGFFNGGYFNGVGNSGFYWSSTPAADTAFASYYYMFSNGAQLIHYPQGDKLFGFSVRCIKQ